MGVPGVTAEPHLLPAGRQPPSQPQTCGRCGPRQALPLRREGSSSGPGGFGHTGPASAVPGSALLETASGPCISSEARPCPATPPFSSQLPPPAQSSLWPVPRRDSGREASGTVASTVLFPLATVSNTAGWPRASVGKCPGPRRATCSIFAAGLATQGTTLEMLHAPSGCPGRGSPSWRQPHRGVLPATSVVSGSPPSALTHVAVTEGTRGGGDWGSCPEAALGTCPQGPCKAP